MNKRHDHTWDTIGIGIHTMKGITGNVVENIVFLKYGCLYCDKKKHITSLLKTKSLALLRLLLYKSFNFLNNIFLNLRFNRLCKS